MRTSRRSRTLATRIAALSAGLGVAALVGLGATAAQALPPTSSTPTTTATATNAATTTGATTTAATTTATTTWSTSTTTTAASTTSEGPRPAPGPPCPGAVAIFTPYLCLPTGSGEDQPAPIGTDGFLEFGGQVVNNGPDVDDATVVITLPAGLQLDPESDAPITRLEQWWSSDPQEDGTLDCTTSQDGLVSTCATGAVPTGANFLVLVDVAAQDGAVAGTSGTLAVTLQSRPDPGAFPSTSVRATVDFVGTAHLQVTLTPAKANVTVGQSLTLVATIHNDGPNAAVDAAGIGLVSSVRLGNDQPFLITNSAPLPGSDPGSAQSPASAFLLRSFATRSAALRSPALRTAALRIAALRPSALGPAATQPPAPIGFWPIGTIAPGATTSVQVVVKAERVGDVALDFVAFSADESCDDPTSDGCANLAMASLSAVAAVTTTATSTSTIPSSTASTSTAAPVVVASGPGTAVLANTGFRATPWLGSAGAAILLGIGMMLLGAPRRRVYGGQHR